MSAEQELLYKVALTKIPNIGPKLARVLVSYCGGIEAVFNQNRRSLEKIPGIGSFHANDVLSNTALKDSENEVEFVIKNNVSALFYLDHDYPARLKHYDDSPVILYKKGKGDINANRMVAIVGTRNASDEGKILCEKLVEDLNPYDVTIISGLAYGIDSHAHKSCIKNEMSTFGVLAHGLDRVYPATNTNLSRQMMEKGGMLTEFTSGTNPDRENFPMRNRIVAGMSDVVVVVESANKGGSLITAEFANGYNKDVFAFPGRPSDENFKGCNKLIKINKAALIESALDIAYVMQWDQEKPSEIQTSLFVELTEEEQKIAELLKSEKTQSMDEMSYKLGKTQSELATLLLGLEFSNVIVSLPGKNYRLR